MHNVFAMCSETAFSSVAERGPGWRERFEKGRSMLRPEIQDILTIEKLKEMVLSG